LYTSIDRAAAGGPPVTISPAAEGRRSPLGLAYLRSAERGDLPDAGVESLAALNAGSPRRAITSAIGLSKWGSSSGAALVCGISAGARAEAGGAGLPPRGESSPFSIRLLAAQASPRRTTSGGSGARRGRKRAGKRSRLCRMSW
jgi:hypothetical protein